LRHTMGKGKWICHDFTTLNCDSAEALRVTRGDFSLAAMMQYPLFPPILMGQAQDANRYAVLTNRVMLAIHEDTGPPPEIVASNANASAWVRHLSDGRKAVMFLNHGNSAVASAQGVSWAQCGWRPDEVVRCYDVWAHTNTYSSSGLTIASLPASTAQLFILERLKTELAAKTFSLPQQTYIPTNSIPIDSTTASVTNWFFVNISGIPTLVATNYAAGGWLQKPLWP
jgi:hypothetical protein